MSSRVNATAALLIGLSVTVASSAEAAEKVALFDFEFLNTSPEPTRPDELARVAKVRTQAEAELTRRGYELVDTGPVAEKVANVRSLHDCNGCDLDLARAVGGDIAAVGWVQKVSNLILNINLQLRDVHDGRLINAASVDIRGNTDESWEHGIRYLIKNRLFPPPR